jgi:CheY-like chemotaxis protein
VPDVSENGQIALAKLADKRYDLILMDCQMPVMDGYIATQQLRLLEQRNGWLRHSVIALTAHALEGEREKCLAAGMDDYLAKPIIAEQLMAILATHLGQQAPLMPVSDAINLPEPTVTLWNESAALKLLEGDSELLHDMIAVFLLETPKQLSELAAYQAQGNTVAVANIAHAIKGTVGHFCAVQAIAAVNQLEQIARSGQHEQLQDSSAAVIAAITDLIQALQQAQKATSN